MCELSLGVLKAAAALTEQEVALSLLAWCAGKTISAELTMMRVFNEHPDSKVRPTARLENLYHSGALPVSQPLALPWLISCSAVARFLACIYQEPSWYFYV